MNSYPKVYNLGHRYLEELFMDEVLIEEKVDGSQFSFGVYDGVVKMMTHHQDVSDHPAEGMFDKAMQWVRDNKGILHDGWTYRAEYLRSPKHNAINYGRTPVNNLILFDINTGEECYLGYGEKAEEAARIGLECVTRLFYGPKPTQTTLESYLDCTSVLGGSKVEGVVVKNYQRFGLDKKALMGKYVSEKFKELNKTNWKNENNIDILQRLVDEYKTEARWQKALIHLEERGLIERSLKDIGTLMKEVPMDVESECSEEIKNKLYAHFWPKLRRALAAGLPEWYKKELLSKQFSLHEGT